MIKILTSILRGKCGKKLSETLLMTIEDKKQELKECIENCNIQLPDLTKQPILSEQQKAREKSLIWNNPLKVIFLLWEENTG